MNTKDKLKTKEEITWCPGCPNYMILEAFKQTVAGFIDTKKCKQSDFAMVTDIGCHAKIFDYLNLSGIYGLHGRSIPTALGISIANPKLKVVAFAGDGAVYSEGMEHFIHAFRYNSNMTLILHDNQSFSLTTGQSTPTSQKGFITKVKPKGEENEPFNPIRIAIACGANFVARTNARDISHMTEVFTKAIEHKGFSFVEVIQDCLIFNLDANNKDKYMYKIEDNYDYEKAKKIAEEFNYNSKEGKIPLGIIFSTLKPTLQEKIK